MEEETQILSDYSLDSFSESSAYQVYLRTIKQHPVLPKDKQKELAICYQQHNDLAARELLVNSNLRLVVFIAKKYCLRVQHLQYLDLIQEGNIGLIKAVNNYNPDIGDFSTYAAKCIEQSICTYIKNNEHEIRRPSYIYPIINQYRNIVFEYEQKKKPLPKLEELCKILNVSPKILEGVLNVFDQKMVSLSDTVGDGLTLAEVISDNKNLEDEIFNKENKDIFILTKEILSSYQYYVIYNRVLNEDRVTLQYLASTVNVTREAVRRCQNISLRKLKPYFLEDSYCYAKLLKDIKDREKDRYKYLRIEAISPRQIIKYLFIRDDLTVLEQKLYKLKIFGKYYNYDYKNILGISDEEYRLLLESLNSKIFTKFTNLDIYKEYENEMIKTYGVQIFDLINMDSEKECILKKDLA